MPHKKKKGYSTRAEATAAAARYALKSGSGKPIRIYPCSECHCLHLTTEDRRKGKR